MTVQEWVEAFWRCLPHDEPDYFDSHGFISMLVTQDEVTEEVLADLIQEDYEEADEEDAEEDKFDIPGLLQLAGKFQHFTLHGRYQLICELLCSGAFEFDEWSSWLAWVCPDRHDNGYMTDPPFSFFTPRCNFLVWLLYQLAMKDESGHIQRISQQQMLQACELADMDFQQRFDAMNFLFWDAHRGAGYADLLGVIELLKLKDYFTLEDFFLLERRWENWSEKEQSV